MSKHAPLPTVAHASASAHEGWRRQYAALSDLIDPKALCIQLVFAQQWHTINMLPRQSKKQCTTRSNPWLPSAVRTHTGRSNRTCNTYMADPAKT